MKLIRATIVQGVGPDHVYIETDLPDPCYPYTGKLSLHFNVAADNGDKYIGCHWPDLLYHVVKRPGL